MVFFELFLVDILIWGIKLSMFVLRLFLKLFIIELIVNKVIKLIVMFVIEKNEMNEIKVLFFEEWLYFSFIKRLIGWNIISYEYFKG